MQVAAIKKLQADEASKEAAKQRMAAAEQRAAAVRQMAAAARAGSAAAGAAGMHPGRSPLGGGGLLRQQGLMMQGGRADAFRRMHMQQMMAARQNSGIVRVVLGFAAVCLVLLVLQCHAALHSHVKGRALILCYAHA